MKTLFSKVIFFAFQFGKTLYFTLKDTLKYVIFEIKMNIYVLTTPN